MDGARRILRSVKELATALASSAPVVTGSTPPRADDRAGDAPPPVRRARAARRRLTPPRFARLARPGVGMAAAAVMFAVVGVAGAMQNGAYADFVAREGQPWDIAARLAGFNIEAVSISGRERLSERDVLSAAGIGPGQSMPFLDVADVRDRLLAAPIIKSAQVMKLYPNRLVIAIEERRPAGLWQRDGNVSVVSEDGVPLIDLRDKSYLGLPFVVGDGAQKRLPEYIGLMKSAGDLSKRVKAGVLVAGRRWDIEMTNGVTVRLPEENPGAAVDALVRMQNEARILDRDIMSIDLRARDRVAFRLTEEGVAAREATMRKPRKSGG